jgi:sigma-B regulation protein RsbU (phosphoserine phosphatase)
MEKADTMPLHHHAAPAGTPPANGTASRLQTRLTRKSPKSLTSRDLQQAREVQDCLFPQAVPVHSGWEFAAVCRPARMLAGDYYDLFEVQPGQVTVALGDVMGKGLGAALVMAELHALVRNRFRHGPVDLAGLMEELNDELLISTPPDLFVTLFLGVLNLDTAEFHYVNAGHP